MNRIETTKINPVIFLLIFPPRFYPKVVIFIISVISFLKNKNFIIIQLSYPPLTNSKRPTLPNKE